jgi:hypothetical protein
MSTRSFLPCWLAMVLGLWLSVFSARAHDAGLLTLRFEELGDERYQLEYLARPGNPESEGIPILPADCTWEEDPGLPVGLVRLTFTTDGRPLSAEDRIVLPWKKNGLLVHAFWRSGETARRFFKWDGEGIVIPIGELRAGAGSTAEAARRYTLLGTGHILSGLDHLLFIAGLLMLVKGRRKTIGAILAFTLAHSLTLFLSVTGHLSMSHDLVDVLVALGILFLAVEIVNSARGYEGLSARKPWIIAFVFGLVHGFGFASVIQGLGLPSQDIPLALLFFNLGIELGQLVLIVIWFAIVIASRPLTGLASGRYAWVPAYALGITATCWLFGRSLALFS